MCAFEMKKYRIVMISCLFVVSDSFLTHISSCTAGQKVGGHVHCQKQKLATLHHSRPRETLFQAP